MTERDRLIEIVDERLENFRSPKRWDMGGRRDKAIAVVNAVLAVLRTGCEVREIDGVCGEPILVGKVCYDHAKLGPNDQPLCPITGEYLDGPDEHVGWPDG